MSIATLKEAEAYAASWKGYFPPPSFHEYCCGLETFLEESASWCGLDPYHFYSVSPEGYYESSDNAYGGLDVRWAFHLKPSLADIEKAYVRLMDELREALDE